MGTIEETVEVTRVVADVDWTDECEVVLYVPKRRTKLTPALALELAGDLVQAAQDALSAAHDAVRPVVTASYDVPVLSPDVDERPWTPGEGA